MAANILFQWDYEQDYANEVSFRLYENSDLAVDEIGELNFSLLMDEKEFGDYEYYVTAVRNGLESAPSNAVVVNFTMPAAPTNLRAELVGSITSVSGSVG
jgi:hypothetical protein